MADFFGDSAVKLIRAPAQKPVASLAEALEGKQYVMMAFCGRETPTSRAFTPRLREFYDKYAHDKKFEVIFVCLDKSPGALSAYVESQHGDWLALAFDSAKTVGQQLMTEYKVDSPPAVLVFEITPSGGRQLITTVGREMMIHDEGAEKFPWRNGEADLRRYYRGLLYNILFCIGIAIVIGCFMLRKL